MNSIYKTDDFSIEVVSRGAYLDNDPGYGGKIYAIETATIRLNHVALNQWIMSATTDDRDCYETEHEWEHYRKSREAERDAFNRQVAEALGFPNCKGVTIAQIISEVFGVAYIHEA